MHEAFWNGLFDVRWEEAPLGAEAIRLTVRLRERGGPGGTYRGPAHSAPRDGNARLAVLTCVGSQQAAMACRAPGSGSRHSHGCPHGSAPGIAERADSQDQQLTPRAEDRAARKHTLRQAG